MKRLILPVAAAVVLAAVPFGMGFWGEQRLLRLFDDLAADGELRFTVLKTTRGWFATDVRVLVDFPRQLGDVYLQVRRAASNTSNVEPLSFTMLHRIHHGPFPWSSAGLSLRPRLAAVDSKIEAGAVARLPHTLHTTLAFSGGGHSRIDVPAYDGAEGRWQWRGLQGDVDFGARLARLKLQMMAPGLRWQVGDWRLELGALHADADLSTLQEVLTLGELSLRATSVAVYQGADTTAAWAVEGTEMRMDTRETEDGSSLDSSFQLKLQALRFMGEQVGAAQLSLALRGLDTASMITLSRQARELAKKGVPDDQAALQVMASMTTLLPDLLQRGPVLELSELSFSAEAGRAVATGSVRVDTTERQVLQNPILLVSAIDARLDASIPEAVLLAVARRTLTQKATAQDLNYSPEQMAQLSRQWVTEQVRAPLRSKLIELREGAYEARFRFAKGQARLNGAPFSWPGL